LTETDQLKVGHTTFPELLNVVILVKTNLKRGAQAHVGLFSSDLTLPAHKLIDYSSWRFQVEFNVRDARQFWGLEAFMNGKAPPLTNAVNLSFFMVNLAYVLLAHWRHEGPHAGGWDLKAFFRGRRSAIAPLNLLPDAPAACISERIIRLVTALGTIHPQPLDPRAA